MVMIQLRLCGLSSCGPSRRVQLEILWFSISCSFDNPVERCPQVFHGRRLADHLPDATRERALLILRADVSGSHDHRDIGAHLHDAPGELSTAAEFGLKATALMCDVL